MRDIAWSPADQMIFDYLTALQEEAHARRKELLQKSAQSTLIPAPNPAPIPEEKEEKP